MSQTLLEPPKYKILNFSSNFGHSLGSSAASTTSAASEVNKAGGNGRPGSPFADEDDLFADRDDGVYMQSSSSSSPAASERLSSVTNGGCSSSVTSGSMRPNQPQMRPASCTFANNGYVANRTFLQTQGMHTIFSSYFR